MATATTPSGIHGTGLATESVQACSRHLLGAWSGIPNFDMSDREVAVWYKEQRKVIQEKVEALKSEAIGAEIRELVRTDGGWSKDCTHNAAGKGVREVLRALPLDEKDRILQYLQQV